jgi:hypothetical protein
MRACRVMIDAAVSAAASIAIMTAVAAARLPAQEPAPRPARAPCDVFCHARLAHEAEAKRDYAEQETHVRAVAALAPSHPGVVYEVARGLARRGRTDAAVAALQRLGAMGDTRDPHGDVLFIPLRTARGYASARNRLLANRLPILDGSLAFELPDPDFLPEALAYDSVRQRFLVGSLNRRAIVAVAPNGVATPFIANVPGMLRVVGIHIDAERGRLWFATWAPDSTRLSDSSEVPSATRLFLADLATGRIQRSWAPDRGRTGHLLNDFVVLGDGSLLLTDTERGSIYRLRSPSDTLELFVQPDPERFSAANGITAAPDGRTLYVAFVEGIAHVDLATRAVTLMPSPDSVSTAAIDGLYWYRGSLVAVQGVPTLQRVIRFTLAANGRRIESGMVMERGLAVVNQPTTGTIVGARFYYIANSQYGRLGENGILERPTGAPVRSAVRVIDLRW